MSFWDASALAPLLAGAGDDRRLEDLYGDGRRVWIWWVTPVEIASSIARRERGGELTREAATRSYGVLERAAATWNQVMPTDPIRESAKRLLRVHTLRAADSLQLAAALTLGGNDPGGLDFVCRDARLADAAAREGLRARTA